jgi:hypothetical protein
MCVGFVCTEHFGIAPCALEIGIRFHAAQNLYEEAVAMFTVAALIFK